VRVRNGEVVLLNSTQVRILLKEAGTPKRTQQQEDDGWVVSWELQGEVHRALQLHGREKELNGRRVRLEVVMKEFSVEDAKRVVQKELETQEIRDLIFHRQLVTPTPKEKDEGKKVSEVNFGKETEGLYVSMVKPDGPSRDSSAGQQQASRVVPGLNGGGLSLLWKRGTLEARVSDRSGVGESE